MQLGRGFMPPDREVLLEGSTKVGAVRGWLRYDLVESFVRALPISSLDLEERHESQGCRKSQDPVLGLRSQDWSH